MIYLIQTTLYTGLLYIAYLLFLRNKGNHNWSRAYLLLNMVVPFLIPLIAIPIPGDGGDAASSVMLPVIDIGTKVSQQVYTISWLPAIYIAMCCVLTGYLVAQSVQVALFIRRHGFEKQGGIRLIRSTGMGPGSWFSYVFIPDDDADAAVLRHEAAHARYGHSYDVVLLRILQCMAWPNVLIWIIAKELRNVHEFQADAAAADNEESYKQTLLNELFHTKHFSLSHTFFHHPIKRRIMMLQRKNLHAGRIRAVLLSLLLVTGMLYVQCAKDTPPKKSAMQSPEQVMDGAGVYDHVDKMPEFDGDLMEFLRKRIKYPEAAKAKNIEGRVLIKFVVDEEGNVRNAQALSSPDPSLSEAALSVVNSMPKWKPGENNGKKAKGYYILPLSYKLDAPKTRQMENLLQTSGYKISPVNRKFTDQIIRGAGVTVLANGTDGC